MRKRLLLRADGSVSIGMGHVIRCLALAEMLQGEYEIHFAIMRPDKSVRDVIDEKKIHLIDLPPSQDFERDAENFIKYISPDDIVVIDGYHFRTSYQNSIKSLGVKLVAIDDLPLWHHKADLVINHTLGVSKKDYSVEQYTRLCLGPDYALLRSPFLIKRDVKIIKGINDILISMGSADINNNTEKFIRTLVALNDTKRIHLVLGPVNPHVKSIEKFIDANKHVRIVKHVNLSAGKLSEILQKTDLCICPASGISQESCAVGVGLIAGYTSDNQRVHLQGLVERRLAFSLGDLSAICDEELIATLKQMLGRIKDLNQMIRNQKKMIDGKSADRIRNEIGRLSKVST